MDELKTIRPTKKQRQLLAYISTFITEHGYSPSYREIMNGCNYTSVATVALHVNSLIKRGHLRKRDYSARSLELTMPEENKGITSNQINPSEEKWLVEKIDNAFSHAEMTSLSERTAQFHNLLVLVEALRILGLDSAANSFRQRLNTLTEQDTTGR